MLLSRSACAEPVPTIVSGESGRRRVREVERRNQHHLPATLPCYDPAAVTSERSEFRVNSNGSDAKWRTVLPSTNPCARKARSQCGHTHLRAHPACHALPAIRGLHTHTSSAGGFPSDNSPSSRVIHQNELTSCSGISGRPFPLFP